MKNYPRKCVSCCQREVFPEILPEHIFQEILVKDVPITKCKNCGNIYFTDESDDYMRNYKYVATTLKKFLTDDEIENGFPGFRARIDLANLSNEHLLESIIEMSKTQGYQEGLWKLDDLKDLKKRAEIYKKELLRRMGTKRIIK